MFVKPNCFEYLLFNLNNWSSLSEIEKARATFYFLQDRGGVPPKDWEMVTITVKQFEKFINEDKIVRIK